MTTRILISKGETAADALDRAEARIDQLKHSLRRLMDAMELPRSKAAKAAWDNARVILNDRSAL